MLKIICNKCGSEIKSLSSRLNAQKNTGVQVGQEHFCAECVSGLSKKPDGK